MSLASELKKSKMKCVFSYYYVIVDSTGELRRHGTSTS